MEFQDARSARPNKRRRWLTAGLFAFIGTGFFEAASSRGKFLLFDAMFYNGKPNLQRLGLQPLPAVEHIWRNDASRDHVEEDGIRKALGRLPPRSQTFFLDIENWPLLDTTPEVRRESVQRLMRVAEIVRGCMPAAKFGYYDLPPAGTYWPLVDPQNRASEHAEWVEANRELEPLAALVDFIFPSLYTFYDDRRGWLTYADETIKAARRYGKPVYPFLWSEYHDSNAQMRDHTIDQDAWKEELKFCHAHADGIVLWGGYSGSGHRLGWSESAEWWQAVRREFNLTG
jgi:hypothetical protein